MRISLNGVSKIRGPLLTALESILANMHTAIATVNHSGKQRARESAELLVLPRRISSACEAMTGLAPLDPVEEVVDRLTSAREDMMLVGHQPHLGRLASRLLSGRQDSVQFGLLPGSAICLEFSPSQAWQLNWLLRSDCLPVK